MSNLVYCPSAPSKWMDQRQYCRYNLLAVGVKTTRAGASEAGVAGWELPNAVLAINLMSLEGVLRLTTHSSARRHQAARASLA
jgi:hypothetical protein